MDNKKILIGSRAIRHWFTDFNRGVGDNCDYDYIVKKIPNHTQSIIRHEYHLNPVFKNYAHSIMSPNDLYTLKVSHAIGWDIKWEKTMWDINYLKNKGCKMNLELFKELYAYWNRVHGQNKRSDLEMSAEQFFDNALPKDYDHDFLHTLIKQVPTYTKVLKDGTEVEVSEEKFNKLSFEEKCDLVREEVMVMAFERFSKYDYRVAYSKMLKKFIINHAPIWEALFIVENYVSLHKAKFNFINLLNEKLQNK